MYTMPHLQAASTQAAAAVAEHTVGERLGSSYRAQGRRSNAPQPNRSPLQHPGYSHQPTADDGASYQGVVQPAKAGRQAGQEEDVEVVWGGDTRRPTAGGQSAIPAPYWALQRRHSQLVAVRLVGEVHHAKPQALERKEYERAQPERHGCWLRGCEHAGVQVGGAEE